MGIDFKPVQDLKRRWTGGDWTCGPWKYHAHNRTITHKMGHGYEIDVEEFTTSAQVLDWIFHLSKQGWVTRRALGDFVFLLDDLFEPMVTLCPGGGDVGPVNPKQVLTQRASRNAR